ncbi:MAG: ABC transporter permease [Dermabacter sp.]|nr:ABC transporter permease [Dermabacter sp.]
MSSFIIRKLLMMIPMTIIVSIVVFFAMRLSPVDPLLYAVSPDQMNSGNIDELRASMGLDDPIIIQYLRWVADMATGNFGYSIQSGESIASIYATRLPATLQLTLIALLISSIVGITLGLLAASFKNRLPDYAARGISVIGAAIPEFFIGIIVLQIFAYWLGWFPSGGRLEPGSTSAWDSIPNMILPVLTLSFGMLAVLIRYTRSSALDVIGKEYVKTARSKGISESRVFFSHVLRNALGPVLIVLVLRLPILVGGSVLIETIFRWPGIGRVIVTSVASSDYPVIMATTLLIAVAILIASFLIDIVKAALDPRIRLS